MKRYVYLILVLLPFCVFAQSKLKAKNYPSLLWEITGNGMKKPSWLFGTMHVSSKLAFHLADSFYLGIRNADVVALETNPESWQEDMSKYQLANTGYDSQYRLAVPNDYFSINTLRFFKYDKKIERALYSNPSAINNLLYRSNESGGNDFEEDTYLDMYIYQCGKRWGKKVAGVERYAESMKLMMEAYKDAAKDKNTRVRSYDTEDGFASSKLQEAYRSGNLDWLDSINKYNSFSAAFDEKFLYKRNEIQASSIDSILKSGQSLFVGVGAAHLPGNRGVIEMLRRAGYRLRPVKMGVRDSQHKNLVEKVRVAVPFTSQQADDGLYKVDIPGKFYKFGEDASLDQRQYADMANGSYYMVTRVSTNAWMWGHNSARVMKIVDSLLYENIPGKIVAKTKIVRNGYPGIDLTNKTRRGDIQRYNIFITPFEVVIFKMSGTGDYVKNGEEAKAFFGSIQLKEYKPAPVAMGGNWKKYSPSYGGFSIDLPHEPNISNDGSWIYDAEDKINNMQYRVIRSDIHNYHFAEEDTFDLSLMAESFESSDFIDKQESRVQKNYKGYPALDCRYRDKNGGVFLTRFIIQGPHYYTLVAHASHPAAAMDKFLNSFEIQPFHYSLSKERKDTTLYYTVKSPVFPEDGKAKLDIPKYSLSPDDDDELEENDLLENGAFRSRVIANDSTGEKIFVSFFKMQRYVHVKDSALLDKESQSSLFSDSSGIVKLKRRFELPDKTRVWETVITDTGSSRTVRSKVFYKNGIGYALLTQSDTLSKPSSFVQSFFDSFAPVDTLTGINPFIKKTDIFFADFMSADSIAHKRAVKNTYSIKLDSADLEPLKKAIAFLGWKEKKYLDVKKDLIAKMDDVKTRGASDYLQQLYYAAGDTIELQHKVLEILLQQKTPYAYTVFKNIMLNEPPVIDIGRSNDYSSAYSNDIKTFAGISYDDGNFMDELHDSLQLTKTILPELLPLLNLDDYKYSMMQLLAEMVDSNLIKPKDYDIYFSKFLIECKQELKRQAIAEKQKAISKAEENKEEKKDENYDGNNDTNNSGNEKLQLYATLLLPYWDINPAVPSLFKQLLASGDGRLVYDAMLLLVRNKRPYPDSLLNHFAALDNYRYELYADLRDIDMREKFPAAYNNHIALAKSKLLGSKLYDKPDSVVYLDKLDAGVKNKKGFIYFFKYKAKRDDANWRIALVGLVSQNVQQFELEEEEKKSLEYPSLYNNNTGNPSFDFTAFTDAKLRADESIINQLKKQRKRLLYSTHKSAREFYDRDEPDSYRTESEND